jgi:D-alanyl-D-alanine carboxypeptidase/D-alanyl-D-alanine-endopeptidase (penicillin-binding protein 4)
MTKADRRTGGQADSNRLRIHATRIGPRIRPACPPVRLSALFALMFSLTSSAGAQTLQQRIDARLDAAPFNRALWGVALVDESGRLLYGRNADRLFIPASNTKVAVATVASALLPPDWRVKTSVYGGGPVIDGVLQGNLVLYGRGDPTFSNRCYSTDTMATGVCDRNIFVRLRQLADSLRGRGISSIAGDLVGDGSYFEPLVVHGGWETYDLNWWYAAPVTGLSFNDNSIDIKWGPGPRPGSPATVSITPWLGDLTFENRSRTRESGGDDIDFFRAPGTLEVRAEGSVAQSSRGGTEYFAMPDPNLFTARAFRQALSDAGISITGTTRSTTDSMAYRQLRAGAPLAEVESRPLTDWIFPILNTSQNLFAEMMLKQLGRIFGPAGSWQEGLKVERRFLIDSVGIDSTQLSLSDGSGLSSVNLVSPRAFTQMLRYIRRHPRWATFAAGLPQSGNVGSLRNRFKNTPLEGRVWAKTGSISRVNTLSGIIEPENGRRLFFSIQANHHTLPGRQILAQIDSIVVEMGKR